MHNMGKCHIPYPRSLFRRTQPEQFEHLHRLSCALAAKAPEDQFRKELTLWPEYLLRFKRLADKLMKAEATLEEVDAFVDWIHHFKDTRVFVHTKFDTCFDKIREVIKSGKPRVHFDIPREDEYVLKHDDFLA